MYSRSCGALLTAPNAWSTQIALNRQHGVTLRKIAPGTTLVLDPLGNLVVKQQIVPLNTSRDLDTFGGAPIAGARRFNLKASIEGVTQDVNNVRDSFAPGQFFAMADDEKLASPSFEDMDAGAIFGSDAIVIDDGARLFAPLDYETIIIDEEGLATKEEEDRYILVAHRFFQQVRFSAVGTAAVRSIGAARFRNLERPAAVSVRTEQYVIASVADGIVPPTAQTRDVRGGACDVEPAQSRRGGRRSVAGHASARDGGVISDVSRTERQCRVSAMGPPGRRGCDQRRGYARLEHAWRGRAEGDARDQHRAGRPGHGASARACGRRRHRSARDRAGGSEAEHDRLRAELLRWHRVRPARLPVVVHACVSGRGCEAAAVVVPGRRATAGRA